MLKRKIKLIFRRETFRRLNKKQITPVAAPVLEFKVIPWGSQAYLAGIDLRNDSLNIPSNLPLITSVPDQEAEAIHLVAMIQDQVVGTLFLDGTEREHVAQVKQVAISPNFRGQRIGQQLMAYAEVVAQTYGYAEIILNARDTAWNFYAKLNYQTFGEIYSNGTNAMQPYRKVLQSVPQEELFVVA